MHGLPLLWKLPCENSIDTSGETWQNVRHSPVPRSIRSGVAPIQTSVGPANGAPAIRQVRPKE